MGVVSVAFSIQPLGKTCTNEEYYALFGHNYKNIVSLFEQVYSNKRKRPDKECLSDALENAMDKDRLNITRLLLHVGASLEKSIDD